MGCKESSARARGLHVLKASRMAASTVMITTVWP